MQLAALMVAMVGFATGCLSLQEEMARQEQRVLSGQYEVAYAAAARLAEDAGADGADANFWNADAGTLALMAGKPQAAVTHLDAADNGFNDVARRRYGTSVLDTTAAIAVSDGVNAYAPEGVDRVFVNLYKALAYGVQGDTDALRVELNRTRERQYEWFYACTREIQEQQEVMSSLSPAERERTLATLKNADSKSLSTLDASQMAEVVSEQTSAEKFFGALRGFGNAYASHLAGITRWCAGDNSRNDLAMAYALAPDNSYVAQDHALEKSGTVPEKRVWIYVEDGLAPRRVSHQVVLPYVRGVSLGTITFDMPTLKARAAASYSYTVNGTIALLPLVAVDGLVQDQFDRQWMGILTRQIARTVSRIVAQETTQHLIRSQTDDALIALLVSLLFATYDVATNVADLRCADLLPKTVWMAAFDCPADGVVTLRGDNGLQVRVKLDAPGNTLLWVRNPSATAMPTIFVVDLGQR